MDALCEEDFPTNELVVERYADGVSLYNEAHCNACKNWTNDVFRWQLWALLIIEHCLLLLKMLLAFLIPDTPRWIIDANARKEFQNKLREEKKRRASTVYQLDKESRDADAQKILESITLSDDVNDGEEAESPGTKGRKRLVSDHV